MSTRKYLFEYEKQNQKKKKTREELIKKIYEFIIKYNKRSRLKLSPRAPKFVEPALF